ncbi:MAG: AAA family ATPase [Candidatus Bathyarchaeia archaeon]
MRIEIVQLENIRSHIKSTVPFTRGFNCLVGGLGCGKSSVLYGIDFAFFGDPIGRSFDYLIREGANSAKVTVQFKQNGNTFTLTRGIKRRGKGISQDLEQLKLFQDEKLIASMNTGAIAEQFKAITGLDRDLWREIVWVRQEHLKELIDAAPRDRQKRLDELFGLSDYEVAWSSIAEYQREYEIEKRVLEKDPDVTGREKLGAEYNRLTEEFTLLEIELQNAVEKLAVTKRFLDEADAKLKRLEEKRLAVEELRRKEARLQAEAANCEEAAAQLARRLRDKKTIVDNLQQRLNSTEAQIKACRTTLEDAGVPADQPAKALRPYLLALDDRISSLKAEAEAASRSMQEDQKRVAQLSTETEQRCPLCLQPLNDAYKSAMLQRIGSENAERQTAIASLKSEVDQVQRQKHLAWEACSNLESLAARLEDLRPRVAEEEKNCADLQNEFAAAQQRGDEVQRQLRGLRSEIGRFDLADVEAAREQSRQALRQYSLVESDLKYKENRKRDLVKRLDEVRERIDQAQQKLERMERIGKTVQIIAAIRDAYRSIQPKLRSEFVKVLRNFVQQVLDTLVGAEAPLLNVVVDETYTPYVKSESGLDREVASLSGGERTLLAFAYRLGLGQLIMQSRTGHGLGMLLLDEPTESLGREDGSIDRLAEAISRFRAIEQIIAVTHSEAFAEKAETVIVLEKEAGVSKVSISGAQ